MAPATVGTIDFQKAPASRHDGLLNRLAAGRARTPPAAPPVRDSADPVHSATPLSIGTRLGTFEVTGVLHRDLSGIVYAGEDRASPGKVAIKEYLPATLADRMAGGKVGLRSLRYKPSFQEGKDRFLSNGRMLAALDEPALIRVLRCWKQNGTAYMAMPLYEGETLHEVLKLSTPPGESWLKAMLGPLLDALATLHKFECYPCNVTPDSIVMLQDGTPLLFAFGAGRRTEGNASGDLRHDLNPGFAPIEQYAHDPTMPEGPWTDVYAVAAVLRFAITGKPLPALAARMAADTLTPLRNAHAGYSDSFLEAIDLGVSVLPRDRPQTIADFRRLLGIHRAGSSGPSSVLPDASAAAAKPARWTTKFSGEAIREDDTPEGTQAAVTSVDQIVLPPLSSEPEPATRAAASPATVQISPGGLPWKLVFQVFVVGKIQRKLVLQVFGVGLLALGLLVWGIVELRQAPPVTDRASPEAVASPAQPSSPSVAASPAATSTAPASTAPTSPTPAAPPPTATASASLAPMETGVPPAARPAVAEPAPKIRDQVAARTTSALPSTPTAPPVQALPAPGTGKIRLAIKPWGEVLVDGKSRGVSPPLKEFSLPEGRHRIQIRNGDFPGYASELDIKAGSKNEIAHSFRAP